MNEKELEQQLIYALGEMPPDFAGARHLIKKLLEMNEEDSDAKLNLLLMTFVPEYPINTRECDYCKQDLVCIEECPRYTLEYLPEIIRFFIDEGWDNHKYGLNLLVALLYTTDAKVILDIAQQICEAGIDADKESLERLLCAIADSESYVRCRNKDYTSAEYLRKYYEAILRLKESV